MDSFKLATAGVTDNLQTHSHFCYSDFNDIFPSIQRLDADVISIEASKSDMKLLNAFKSYSYSNQIGPGVYDIHSPRVPSQQEIKDRLRDTLAFIPADLLFVNPVSRMSYDVDLDLLDFYRIVALKLEPGRKPKVRGSLTQNDTEFLLVTIAALINVVEAAKWARETYA